MLDIILITIGLIGLTIATITDIKTKEIPDWLSYSLIATGFAIRLLYSIVYTDFLPLFYTIIAFALVFSFGSLLYYTKQWGGGDTKILAALSTFFAVKPSYLPEIDVPFLLILITNILFIGALYGLIWGIVLVIKHKKRFKEEIILLLRQERVRNLAKYSIIISIFWMLLLIMFKASLFRIILLFLVVFSPCYFLLWLCTKAIENSCMYKKRTIENLRLGDWLAEDIIQDGKLIAKRTAEGLTNLDIKNLKDNNIKTITIKEGIPFIPPFLIATILTLIRNKFLFLISL